MSEKIHGIFTPHIVPVQANGEIDEPELRRYIDWLIEKGVHGLYPNGSTGEFTRFTADADREDRLPTDGRPRAGVGWGGRGERARNAGRLRDVRRLRRPGRGHRFALLLQALPRIGLRLLPLNRVE